MVRMISKGGFYIRPFIFICSLASQGIHAHFILILIPNSKKYKVTIKNGISNNNFWLIYAII